MASRIKDALEKAGQAAAFPTLLESRRGADFALLESSFGTEGFEAAVSALECAWAPYPQAKPLLEEISRMREALGSAGLLSGSSQAPKTAQSAAQRKYEPTSDGAVKALSANDLAGLGAVLEANPGAWGKTSKGMVPLSLAAMEGFDSAVVLLLSKGADPNVQDADGMSPLAWACSRGKARSAAALLAKGADPNARDANGRTALHLGAPKLPAEVLGAFKMAKALPDLPDTQGRTALHVAALFGSEEFAAGLIEKLGFKTRMVEKGGKTAAELAREKGRKEMAAMLEKKASEQAAQSRIPEMRIF